MCRHRPGRQSPIDATYDLMQKLQTSNSGTEICAYILGYAGRFGVTNILAGTIPDLGRSTREQLSNVVLGAWPQGWTERYFSQGYLYRDPAISLVRRGCTHFRWSEIDNLCNISSTGRRVLHEASEFRLREGLTIGFTTIERRMIGLSFAGERLVLDPAECRMLQLIGSYAVGCALVLNETERRRPLVHLSPRQREVLLWASEGLRIDEIAERLRISSHTADMHLRSARERLGVTSTVHAVAEAFRRRLLV
jgi:LuxR family quorum sensing-dependent transcriptional regulator